MSDTQIILAGIAVLAVVNTLLLLLVRSDCSRVIHELRGCQARICARFKNEKPAG